MVSTPSRRKIIALVIGPVIGLIALFVGTTCVYAWLLVDPPILYDPAPIYPGARKVDEEIDPLSGGAARVYRVTEDYQEVFEWYDASLQNKDPDWRGDWSESSPGCKSTTASLLYFFLVGKRVFIEICVAKDVPSDTIIYTDTWYR